jgi:glycosyltransferase involved in cell wall biosynthesis
VRASFPRLGERVAAPPFPPGWPGRATRSATADAPREESGVSVVTPCLNPGSYLAQAMDSVANQARPALEHIVVDGGSTDGTVASLAARAGRLSWISEPDGGQADAVNKGLSRVRGGIVGWLNADDLYLPDTLARVAEFFAATPGIDVVYGDCYYLYEERSPHETRLVRGRPFDLDALLDAGCYIPQPSAFWRRRVHSLGLLDPAFRFAMDYEYWLRLARAGARFAYLPEPLACFRLTPRSKSGAALDRFWPEVRRASLRYGGRRLNPMLVTHLKTRLRARFPRTYDLAARLRKGAVS